METMMMIENRPGVIATLQRACAYIRKARTLKRYDGSPYKTVGDVDDEKLPLERFDPDRHIPASNEDMIAMERALFEGWELMVDSSGTVWIGDREERIAEVTFR